VYSVAEAAGVSIATVSRVLHNPERTSPETRQQVLTAIAELNYVQRSSARSLAVGRHEAHGLILPTLDGPYFTELVVGYESAAAELGQSVVLTLAGGKDDRARAARKLATRVDGLVVFGGSELPTSAVSSLAERMPVILVAGDAPHPEIEAIGTENLTSAVELTIHLFDHGRRRLLFVGDPGARDVRDRLLGFVQAHRAQLEVEPADPILVNCTESGGRQFADAFLAGRYQADGLVCANDEVALAVMDRLQRHGVRIPDDVAVVGWDNIMASRYVRPGLTTVSQPVHELGALVANRLHARIGGATVDSQRALLPTSVVLRSSCGCVDTASGGRRHLSNAEEPHLPLASSSEPSPTD
jgi:LacI family transcriptional regulator